ncbi:MAG: 2-hydroxyacyl-CoA dehydratase, partial [Bdellovibrionales bacterium]|nr:2-hydroxyacyl-CoA dehydratase [Bdellovibrionales bacterium]
PSEILTAFGYQVYYPENHGAMLGATRTSNECIPQATSLGYSPDICSYLTSDIGSHLLGKTPLTRAYGIPHPPRPDVLVYSTNQCHEVQEWFSYYGREFNVPVLGIHPPWKAGPMTTLQLAHVKDQYLELIKNLETLNKTSFDYDRFHQVLGNSATTSKLWREFLNKMVNRPSPATFFDSCIQMGPAVVLRGLPEANDYYRQLNQEMDQKITAGEGALEKERIRLFWDGMPVWGKLRYFSELFKENASAVVASTYCNSWVFDFDLDDPLLSMARAYTGIFINRSEEVKEKVLAGLIDEYQIDGVIYHDSKTCPHNSNNRFGLPQRLQQETKVPYLVVDGDLNDLRCFSQEQTTTSLEAFVEQLSE